MNDAYSTDSILPQDFPKGLTSFFINSANPSTSGLERAIDTARRTVPAIPRPRGLRFFNYPRKFRRIVFGLVGLLLSAKVLAADFTVTTPGFFYAINENQPNPTLTLVRGKTYTFAVSAESDHPFFINSPGVSNNNISQGTITYTVPNVASNYNYFCSIHDFGAAIFTVAPTAPPPPEIHILSLSVSNSLFLSSTGTNGWSVIPEFSTNLTTTNWFALSVLSNRFLNGTNETFCGRPPGTNVFIRVRSQPN